ncbi:LZTFL1 isoform 6 [Pongo abelii]|uniref:LZTFL1 isoform 6 n=1 Tax=Pongo abelii TaxID=9601 RepID=A0A2J8TFC5_PONAB|nr:LZTFL1 isoform 6 [Pongo abelii]
MKSLKSSMDYKLWFIARWNLSSSTLPIPMCYFCDSCLHKLRSGILSYRQTSLNLKTENY